MKERPEMKKKETLMKASRPQRQMKKSFERQVDERDGGETGEEFGGDLWMFFSAGGGLTETADKKPRADGSRMNIKHNGSIMNNVTVTISEMISVPVNAPEHFDFSVPVFFHAPLLGDAHTSQ